MILLNLLKNLTTMSLCLTLRKAELYVLVARRRKVSDYVIYGCINSTAHSMMNS